MALGYKGGIFRTSRAYTLEELFEAIKFCRFTAGVPSFIKDGKSQMIAFPPLDLQNWVQVVPIGHDFAAPSSKWLVKSGEKLCPVCLTPPRCISGSAENIAKRCSALVILTAGELEALSL